MMDVFDTRRVPDDEAYWDALAQRVAEAAAREAGATSFDWLAQSRMSWVAASLLLAGALTLLLLPNEARSARKMAVDWEQALAPTDEIGRAMLSGDAPPAVGVLLLRDARDG
ncbi:MAG: hypothetical protein ACRENH_13690 [Gemmatimonadaceae bacterium]